jgi:hypothetical protein
MHVPIQRVFTTVARNLGLKDFKAHIDSWVEWAFEGEQYIGSLSTFERTERTYKTDPTQASTTITITVADISNGDTLTINDAVFIFKTTATAINQVSNPSDIATGDGNLYNEITIAATDNAMASDIQSKLNASYYPNVALANYTVSTNVITITYKDFGCEGNNFTLDTNSKGISLDENSLVEGYDKLQNNQIKLPDNFIKLLSVRSDNTVITPSSSQFRSKISTYLNRYYINGNRMNFSNNDYTQVTISYLSVPLGPDGFPTIKQGHEAAVAQYIMWQHKLIDYYNGKIAQYIIKDLEKRWYYLCAKVRGDDNMPNSAELVKIGKIWNSKLPITSYDPPLYDGLNSY